MKPTTQETIKRGCDTHISFDPILPERADERKNSTQRKNPLPNQLSQQELKKKYSSG
ncbi:MAG: hypothetical protein ACJA02_000664 [Myxococcota bacterium]|jgi:hypothetical protein